MKTLRCTETLTTFLQETLPSASRSNSRFFPLRLAIVEGEVKEAERSHGEIAATLRKALRVKLAAASTHGDAPYCDAIEFYPSTFIYMLQGAYYSAPYSIDDAGAVTIGEAVEVMPVVTYEPVKPPASAPEVTENLDESEILGDCIPLSEAGLRSLQEATAEIRVATPGWGTSGYYSAEVLKRDGPKIFPTGTKMYWNHPTESENEERPEGDLDKLAAVTIAPARWLDQGPEGAGLYTKARLREKYAADIAELKNDIGVSLRAFGRFSMGKAEGKEGVIIEQLVGGKSIDFVTQAGRGGKVLELFESAGQRNSATTAAESRKQEANSMAMTEAEIKQLQEATTAATSANATVQRLANELLQLRAEQFITSVCESVSLPLAVRKRVVASMRLNPIVKDGSIDEAPFAEAIKAKINEELAYLKEAGVSGVTGFGSTTKAAEPEKTVTLEEAEKEVNEALAALAN